MGIQLLIPMAGRGSRFAEAGYTKSKPLLEIHGVPMFEIVLGNLVTSAVSKVVIVAQKSWGISGLIAELNARLDCELTLIEIDYITEGPASTVLLAEPFLDPEHALVVANSDQFINKDLSEFYASLSIPGVSGAVLTMLDSDPKWSYVRLDSLGFVIETREKQVISEYATVGVYGFSTAHIALQAIKDMISKNARENGEFYVGPAFNFLKREHGNVMNFPLGPVGEIMFGLGIPVDFENFVSSEVSHSAVSLAKRFLKSGSK